MKKYKVLTDNLDWYGVSKGVTLINETHYYAICDTNGIYGGQIPISEVEKILKYHPTWLEKVKENQEYVDIEIEFLASPETAYTDIRVTDRLYRIVELYRHENGEIQKVLARSYSPRVQSVFTKEDMMGFSKYCMIKYHIAKTMKYDFEGDLFEEEKLINEWLKSKEK